MPRSVPSLPAAALLALLLPVAPGVRAQEPASPEVLADLAKRFEAASTPSDRVAIVDAIAALDPERTSPTVTAVLAETLDETPIGDSGNDAVATHVLEQLVGRDPAAALPALIREAGRVREAGDAVGESARDAAKLPELETGKSGLIDPKDLDKFIKSATEAKRRLTELADEQRSIDPRRDALLTVLGTIRDDRAVRAVASLLPGLAADNQQRVLDVAFAFGSKSGWRVWVDHVVDLERRTKAADKDLAKLRREKPRKRPKGMDRERWKQQEQRRIDRRVAVREEFLARWATEKANLLDYVRTKIRDAGLPDGPPRIESRAWRRWLSSLDVPDKLGRVHAAKD